jgi:hypothetical protein
MRLRTKPYAAPLDQAPLMPLNLTTRKEAVGLTVIPFRYADPIVDHVGTTAWERIALANI